MAAYPEFFNDVFGPVMQPGSSSHTAAPCRLGRLAGDLLGEKLARVRVLFDRKGSFAGTFGVMAEDRAMVAGALGMAPDDRRLFSAFELAAEAGVTCSFEFTSLTESYHPNAMKFELTGASGRTVTLVGVSTGGGMVETVVVDGFPLQRDRRRLRAAAVRPAAGRVARGPRALRRAAARPGLGEQPDGPRQGSAACVRAGLRARSGRSATPGRAAAGRPPGAAAARCSPCSREPTASPSSSAR